MVLFTSRGSGDPECQFLYEHNMEIWEIQTPYYFFLKIIFTRANKAYSMKELFYLCKFCKLPFIICIFKAWILKIGGEKYKIYMGNVNSLNKRTVVEVIWFFWTAVCSIIVKGSWHFFLKLSLLLWMGYSIRGICLLDLIISVFLNCSTSAESAGDLLFDPQSLLMHRDAQLQHDFPFNCDIN